MFDKLHSARLTRLADHLDRAPVLGVGRFDFSKFYGGDKASDDNICGTAGCALGECAFLWPDDWEICFDSTVLRRVQLPVLRSIQSASVDRSAMEWFGLTRREVEHLFVSQQQSTLEFGGKVLTDAATRHEVAANIRAFLAIKAAQG